MTSISDGCILLLLTLSTVLAQDVYQLGVGIADITGPAAEIGMVCFSPDRLLN